MNESVFRRLSKPRSFGRFSVVGLLNTGLGIGLFPAVDIVTVHRIDHNFLLAITYVVCAVSAFLLHRYFTFESKGSLGHEIGRYVVLSAVLFFVNLVLLNAALRYLAVSVDGAQVCISTLTGVVLTLASYLGLNHLVFKKNQKTNIVSGE